jgi:tetratricopeptide (TPR) repeat protein
MNAPRATPSAVFWCAAAIVAATVAAYAGSLRGAFVYDDADSIPGNPSLASLGSALSPPMGATVSGRPVLNLSLAANHALSGTAVRGYHAANVAIHACAALLLLGIVRRSLATPACGPREPGEGLALATAVSLLWALHPLQVESVAYVIQRAESLMGLFYLLMLYALIRQASGGGARWGWVSLVSCLLGMGTKEVMATAPLVALLYDRCFLAGSFQEAWRRRRALYIGYAACWIPLGLLVAHAGGRGGSAGFGSGVPWWAYALTQLKAVALYLRLCVWPHPLVGDYGRILEGRLGVLAACAVLVLGVVASTLALLRRNSPLGFLGAWFLVILAPTSSVIPISTEIIALHRMYLPLAAVVTLGVLAVDRLLGRRLAVAAFCLMAAGLGAATARRSAVYSDGRAFWTDVVLKAPANAGAWNNLGNIEEAEGHAEAAMLDYGRALAIAPDFASAHYNLGRALAGAGRAAEAVSQYEQALRFRAGDPSLHFNLGNALALEKRPYAAAAEYRAAIAADPARADAWFGLGDAMADVANLKEAAEAYSRAVALRPDFVDARVDLGGVLAQEGRLPEAAAQLREALRLQPVAADIHNNLGSVLARSGDLAGAREQFEEAVRLRPDYAEARENLRNLGGTP